MSRLIGALIVVLALGATAEAGCFGGGGFGQRVVVVQQPVLSGGFCSNQVAFAQPVLAGGCGVQQFGGFGFNQQVFFGRQRFFGNRLVQPVFLNRGFNRGFGSPLFFGGRGLSLQIGF